MFYVARRLRWATFLSEIVRKLLSLYKMGVPIRLRVF